jgi:hypothetical protein
VCDARDHGVCGISIGFVSFSARRLSVDCRHDHRDPHGSPITN